MNENINLCEILKDCQKGTKLYSPLYGEVEFIDINPSLSHPIIVEATTRNGLKASKTFSKKGHYDDTFNGICTLVPSLEQPDWSKWKCPKPKKSKFDPKTLKPFDRVLVRNFNTDWWRCGLFSFFDKNNEPYLTCGWHYIVPYNDETKHLVGTTDEAPDYYRYWED